MGRKGDSHCQPVSSKQMIFQNRAGPVFLMFQLDNQYKCVSAVYCTLRRRSRVRATSPLRAHHHLATDLLFGFLRSNLWCFRNENLTEKSSMHNTILTIVFVLIFRWCATCTSCLLYSYMHHCRLAVIVQLQLCLHFAYTYHALLCHVFITVVLSSLLRASVFLINFID